MGKTGGIIILTISIAAIVIGVSSISAKWQRFSQASEEMYYACAKLKESALDVKKALVDIPEESQTSGDLAGWMAAKNDYNSKCAEITGRITG
jgi:hypothetical protein